MARSVFLASIHLNVMKGFSRAWLKLSLRLRLGLVSGGITFLLALILSEIAGRIAQHRAEQDVGNALTALAYHMADRLDHDMFERYREIQVIAELQPFRDPQSSLLEQRRLLEKLQSTYPYYSWIGFANPQGTVRVSTQGLLEGQNVATRSWFTEGRKALFVGDVHEAVLLAKLLPNPNGHPIRFVDIAVPIKNSQGQVLGVLGTHLSWTWAKDIEAALRQVQDDRSQEIFVLAQDGTVLLGPKPWQEQKIALSDFPVTQSSGYQIQRWPDGQTYLTGFAKTVGYRDYPGLGWVVLVRQDTRDAFAVARRLHNQILIGGALLGVGFALLTALAANRITKPMLEIAAAADQIRQGNRAVTIPTLLGQDETAKLSQSLSQLVGALVTREQELKWINERLESQLVVRQQMAESLRRSEEKFRQIAENIHDVFWIFSLTRQQWLYVSPAYEAMWGQSWETLLDDPDAWMQAIHPDDQEHVAAIAPQRFQGQLDAQYRICHQDGSVRWIRDRAFPVYNADGKLYRVVGLLQDITEHKQGEEARQQLEQEREVSELKSQFISLASHEFRTPLTVISTSAALIEKMEDQLSPEKRQQYFSRIQLSIKHLTQVLDEILLIGKAEVKKLEIHPEPLDLVQFCQNLMADMQASASDQHQLLFTHQDDSITALVDESLLRCALSNLLSNAIKYSPQGGQVRLDLIRTLEAVVFQIQDSGIGIPKAEQSNLFGSFYRCSNTGKIQGTGLGLALVKEVVELHQGKIMVQSDVEVGTTFIVEIPSNFSVKALL